MARVLLGSGVLVCLIVGWHLYGASDARRQAEELRSRRSAATNQEPIVVNVITDVVTVPLGPTPPAKQGGANPFEALGNALGSMLGGALAKVIEPAMERDLNLRARENYDLYAILLPYRVRVITPETGS